MAKEERIRAMLTYKQIQSKSNAETVLVAFDEIGKPASSTEIKRYLDQKALSKAQEEVEAKYSNAEITHADIKNYIESEL